MSKKIITEMYDILGKLGNPGDGPRAPSDPTPRDVIGTFMITQDISVMDEAMLESISSLTWHEVTNLAVISTMNPLYFQTLNRSMAEGIRDFRNTWNNMAEEGEIDEAFDRGAFLFLAKACPTAESRARYVQWCTKAIQEASDDVKSKALSKSDRFKAIVPDGMTAAEHAKGVEVAQEYMTPVDLNNKKVMGNQIYDRDPEPNGKAIADKFTSEMDKAARAAGKNPEEMFLNAKIDVDRERIKGS